MLFNKSRNGAVIFGCDRAGHGLLGLRLFRHQLWSNFIIKCPISVAPKVINKSGTKRTNDREKWTMPFLILDSARLKILLLTLPRPWLDVWLFFSIVSRTSVDHDIIRVYPPSSDHEEQNNTAFDTAREQVLFLIAIQTSLCVPSFGYRNRNINRLEQS